MNRRPSLPGHRSRAGARRYGADWDGSIERRGDLRTNGGADFQANVMGATSGTGIGTGTFAPANYIALTANATAPAATDTTLTGELAGTLARAQATFSHTTGAASYSLQKTFTCDAGNTGVVVAKIGVFNASSAGTMVFETLLNATATLVTGDQLTVTETVSL